MTKHSLLLVAALGFLGACDDDNDLTDIGGEADVVVWTADVFGIAPFQYVGGTAEVSFALGTFEFGATAEVFGDTPGAVRPWHVHFGTCASGGDIVGLNSDYLPFVIDGAGADVVSVIVPEPLDVNAFYHVDFFLALDRQDVVIACGDLVLL
jgi:hypothetical protein